MRDPVHVERHERTRLFNVCPKTHHHFSQSQGKRIIPNLTKTARLRQHYLYFSARYRQFLKLYLIARIQTVGRFKQPPAQSPDIERATVVLTIYPRHSLTSRKPASSGLNHFSNLSRMSLPLYRQPRRQGPMYRVCLLTR